MSKPSPIPYRYNRDPQIAGAPGLLEALQEMDALWESLRSVQVVTGDVGLVAMNEVPARAKAAIARATCKTCTAYKDEAMCPRHDGSANCQSGSIASGGHRSHCTCDTCF